MSFGRICLYHLSCPKGKVFTEEEEYHQALLGGWVDAPWEIDNPRYKPLALLSLQQQIGVPPVQEQEPVPAAPEKKAKAPGRPRKIHGGK